MFMTVFEYKYKEMAHLYTKERFKRDAYNTMSKWYDNYCENHSGRPRIPKTIHQVWVGSKPIPEMYSKYMATWKYFHPSWTYKLWRESDIKDIPSIDTKLFNKISNPGAKSDYMRYAILYDHGGIYVDADFECLKPHDKFLHLS